MATIEQDGITFDSVKSGALKFSNWPLTLQNQQGPDEDGGIINAVDIDWNNAQVGEKTINTTGELLAYLNEKIDESSFVNLLNKYIKTDDSLVTEIIQEGGYSKFSIKIALPKSINLSASSIDAQYGDTISISAQGVNGANTSITSWEIIEGNDVATLDGTEGSNINLTINDYSSYASLIWSGEKSERISPVSSTPIHDTETIVIDNEQTITVNGIPSSGRLQYVNKTIKISAANSGVQTINNNPVQIQVNGKEYEDIQAIISYKWVRQTPVGGPYPNDPFEIVGNTGNASTLRIKVKDAYNEDSSGYHTSIDYKCEITWRVIYNETILQTVSDFVAYKFIPAS